MGEHRKPNEFSEKNNDLLGEYLIEIVESTCKPGLIL